MGEWTRDIQNAIAYIEENLTGELEIGEIAKRACVSAFYFQRIFAALCGVSAGEYIRNRRLSLAGEELQASDMKVIDAAMKYGYDSPDSFCRAFQRFHGVSPSAVKKGGVSLRAFAPVRIVLTLEGGKMLEYRIVNKPQFTLMGISREFHPDTSYQEIPAFWSEVMAREDCPVCGRYGVCIDRGEKDRVFDYLIADDYLPFKEIPEGCEAKVIPASQWAVFPCRGPLPGALQEINTRMWSEWLPNCREYALAGNYNIEMYAPPAEKPEDNYCEIWLPVKKV